MICGSTTKGNTLWLTTSRQQKTGNNVRCGLADWHKAKCRYTSGSLGKTDLKSQTPDTLFTATAIQIKRHLTEGWNLM